MTEEASSTAAAPAEPQRHGFRAGGCAVLPAEIQWFDALLANLVLRLRPADRAEADLVEALAVLELKLARLDGLELRVLAGVADESGTIGLPSLGTLVRYRSRLLKERSEIDLRLRQLADSRRTNEAEPAAAHPCLTGLEDLAAMVMAESRPRGAAAGGRGATAPLNRHERRRQEAELRRAA